MNLQPTNQRADRMASMATGDGTAGALRRAVVESSMHQAPGADTRRSRPDEQGSQKKDVTSSCVSSPLESKITDSTLLQQSASSETRAQSTKAVMTNATATTDDDEDLSNGEMDVDADQGTTPSSTDVAEDPTSFSGPTNFVPHPGSYRVSHEEGALHFAMSLDLSDWFDDEDDEYSALPSQ